MKYRTLGIIMLAGLAQPLWAAPLTESTFTEIVKDVQVISTAASATPAEPNELLKAPDRVRTGLESRAELIAPDKTLTRIGANTVFSFADSGRTLNLEQGNILFHAPKGIGGGTIKSGGAVAAVLGTTLIVSATVDGGFKVILLEGHGQVTLPNGSTAVLHAGQMVFVLPKGATLSKILNINLAKLTAGSLLIHGFSTPLPSLPLIESAIQAQNHQMARGEARDTGLTPENAMGQPVGNGLLTLDPGTYQTANHPTLTPQQFDQLFGKGGAGGPGGRPVSSTAPL